MMLSRRRCMLRTQDNARIGVNLFEAEQRGYINDDTGNLQGYHESTISKFIEVNPISKYVIYVQNSKWFTSKLHCYDSNKQYLGFTRYNTGSESSVQFLPKTGFVKYVVPNSEIESTYFKQIS